MIIETLPVGPLETNCYIAGDEATHKAAVIDPGGDTQIILKALARHKLECVMIIITHAHFDHVGGLSELKEKTGAEVVVHADENEALTMQGDMARMFGVRMKNPPPADRTIKEGDRLEIGKLVLEVIHTPGHSPGSVCLIARAAKKVFAGDLLFAGSIGRTDFPGGSFDDLTHNVRTKIFTLGDDFEVFPGHGPSTTVGRERKTNPFF
ncbi:MAG: MBL fold metallo-hydrolase [Myxococcota bacterium]|jgi:glyoxylase-like metal-dependent hydrolase (beta-lactamase superfamily II)